MKKSKLLVLISIAVFAFASCSKNEYVKVIPADAKVVAEVDFKSIVEKCDFDSNKKVLEAIKTMTSIQSTPKQAEYIKKLITDPVESGLDVEQPMYIFVTGDRTCFGMLFAMDSESKFEEFVKAVMPNISSKFKKSGDINQMIDGREAMAYNDDAFLILFGFANSETNLEVKLSQLFKKENPFTETDTYNKMADTDGDAKLWVNLGIIPSALFEATGTDITSMTGGVKLKDINFLSTLTFDKGEMRIESEQYGSNDEAQKKMEATAAKNKTLAGDYMNLATVDCIGWLGVSLNGMDIVDQMNKEKKSKEVFIMLEQVLGIDVKNLMSSISGDCAAAFNCNFDQNMDEADFLDFFVAAAKVSNADFMKDFDKNFKADDVTVTPLIGNIYQLDIANQKSNYDWETGDVSVITEHTNCIFGVNDQNNLVFTSLKGFSPNLFVGTTSALDKYKDEIKSSTCFFYFNVKKLMAAIMKETGMDAHIPSEAKTAIEMLDVIIAKSDNKMHGSARFTVTDNSKNILALYMGILNEFFENNL